MLADGIPTRPRCINVVALKRNEFPADVIHALSDAHRLLYRTKVGLEHARDILRTEGKLLPQVIELLGFVQHQQDGRHGRARESRRAA
jgi:UDP-N-acetylglucosamine acyltransferase